MHWVKFRSDLLDSWQVATITEKVTGEGQDRRVMRNAVAGGCCAVWLEVTRKGVKHVNEGDAILEKYPLSWVDFITGISGLGEAMAEVGWVVPNAVGLLFPKFQLENVVGLESTGKAARQKRYREKLKRDARGATGDACVDARGATEAPREAPRVAPRETPELELDKEQERKPPIVPLGGPEEQKPEEEPKAPRKKKPEPEPSWDMLGDLNRTSVRDACREWFRYKRERKQSYTKTGMCQFFKKLVKEHRTAAHIVASIERSMASNWAGVFPIKDWGHEQPGEQQPQIPAFVPDAEINALLDSVKENQW